MCKFSCESLLASSRFLDLLTVAAQGVVGAADQVLGMITLRMSHTNKTSARSVQQIDETLPNRALVLLLAITNYQQLLLATTDCDYELLATGPCNTAIGTCLEVPVVVR